MHNEVGITDIVARPVASYIFKKASFFSATQLSACLPVSPSDDSALSLPSGSLLSFRFRIH